MSVAVPRLKFCVYLHVKNGVIFYVGMGSLSRAFERDYRHHTWLSLVGREPYEVRVYSWCLNKKVARKRELLAIKKFKPLCNFHHNGFKRLDLTNRAMALHS